MKAHLDAAEQALPQAKAAMMITGDTRDFVAILIAAALTAEDGIKTRYVVGSRIPTGASFIFGPYATIGAALKASQSIPAISPGIRAGVWPLIPSPRVLPKELLAVRRLTTPTLEGEAN